MSFVWVGLLCFFPVRGTKTVVGGEDLIAFNFECTKRRRAKRGVNTCSRSKRCSDEQEVSDFDFIGSDSWWPMRYFSSLIFISLCYFSFCCTSDFTNEHPRGAEAGVSIYSQIQLFAKFNLVSLPLCSLVSSDFSWIIFQLASFKESKSSRCTCRRWFKESKSSHLNLWLDARITYHRLLSNFIAAQQLHSGE